MSQAVIPSLADARISGLGVIRGFPWDELVPAAKFAGVGTAWTVLDYLGHQLLEPLAGEKTPPGYFGNKLLFSIPTLIVGRVVSDLIGGISPIRAFTLATTANSLMQLRYLFTMPPAFNVTCFILHEFILIPLSFLITGKSKDLYQEAGDRNALIQRET